MITVNVSRVPGLEDHYFVAVSGGFSTILPDREDARSYCIARFGVDIDDIGSGPVTFCVDADNGHDGELVSSYWQRKPVRLEGTVGYKG